MDVVAIPGYRQGEHVASGNGVIYSRLAPKAEQHGVDDHLVLPSLLQQKETKKAARVFALPALCLLPIPQRACHGRKVSWGGATAPADYLRAILTELLSNSLHVLRRRVIHSSVTFHVGQAGVRFGP